MKTWLEDKGLHEAMARRQGGGNYFNFVVWLKIAV